jgi:hypothetical protein
VYALLYSYFESFPLVYGPEGYDFKGGVEYLPFAALLVGEVFSFVGYALWAWCVLFPPSLLPSFVLHPNLLYDPHHPRYRASHPFVKCLTSVNTLFRHELMAGTITRRNSTSVEVLSNLRWHYQWVSQGLLDYR